MDDIITIRLVPEGDSTLYFENGLERVVVIPTLRVSPHNIVKVVLRFNAVQYYYPLTRETVFTVSFRPSNKHFTDYEEVFSQVGGKQVVDSVPVYTLHLDHPAQIQVPPAPHSPPAQPTLAAAFAEARATANNVYLQDHYVLLLSADECRPATTAARHLRLVVIDESLATPISIMMFTFSTPPPLLPGHIYKVSTCTVSRRAPANLVIYDATPDPLQLITAGRWCGGEWTRQAEEAWQRLSKVAARVYGGNVEFATTAWSQKASKIMMKLVSRSQGDPRACVGLSPTVLMLPITSTIAENAAKLFKLFVLPIELLAPCTPLTTASSLRSIGGYPDENVGFCAPSLTNAPVTLGAVAARTAGVELVNVQYYCNENHAEMPATPGPGLSGRFQSPRFPQLHMPLGALATVDVETVFVLEGFHNDIASCTFVLWGRDGTLSPHMAPAITTIKPAFDADLPPHPWTPATGTIVGVWPSKITPPTTHVWHRAQLLESLNLQPAPSYTAEALADVDSMVQLPSPSTQPRGLTPVRVPYEFLGCKPNPESIDYVAGRLGRLVLTNSIISVITHNAIVDNVVRITAVGPITVVHPRSPQALRMRTSSLPSLASAVALVETVTTSETYIEYVQRVTKPGTGAAAAAGIRAKWTQRPDLLASVDDALMSWGRTPQIPLVMVTALSSLLTGTMTGVFNCEVAFCSQIPRKVETEELRKVAFSVSGNAADPPCNAYELIGSDPSAIARLVWPENMLAHIFGVSCVSDSPLFAECFTSMPLPSFIMHLAVAVLPEAGPVPWLVVVLAETKSFK